MRPEAVADEIGKVLDRIVELAKRAAPAVAERSGGAA
jgi:hypothetical protein